MSYSNNTFYIDDRPVYNPIGQECNTLSSRRSYITGSEKKIKTIIQGANAAGYIVEDITPSCLAPHPFKLKQEEDSSTACRIHLAKHGMNLQIKNNQQILYANCLSRENETDNELLDTLMARYPIIERYVKPDQITIYHEDPSSLNIPSHLSTSAVMPYQYPDWAIEPTRRPEFISSLELLEGILSS